jgi:heavy metal sensor kinase
VKALRTRLQFWFVGLSGGLLVAFAVLVAWRSERAAIAALDVRLQVRSDTLLAVCEFEDGDFHLELTPQTAAGLAGEAPLRAFLVQAADGRVLASSDAAIAAALAAAPQQPDRGAFTVGSLRAFGRLRAPPPGVDDEPALRIVTAEDLEPTLVVERRLRLTLAVGVLAAVIGAAFAGALLARRVVDPLARLAAAAGRIQAGRGERMPRSGSGDETDQLAAAFEQAMQRLQDALVRQVRFTADASHELRTPLAIVRTQAEVAMHRTRSPDEYRSVLQEIVAGSDRLHAVLESLLVLARADAGHLDYAESDVDLAEVVHAVFVARRAAAAAKQLELACALPPGSCVRGDQQLLAMMIDNLVANAIRYSERPGRVRVEVRSDDGGLVLAVTDSGIGIAADRLPHIWDRFFRADIDRSRAAGGSGLGLSIVRAIAERHGATCRATSELGKGTRIEVRFPVALPRGPISNGQSDRHRKRVGA